MKTDRQTFESEGLECHVRVPTELTATDRELMYRLMTTHYEKVDRSDFQDDLAEKEWVIVMSDSQRGILGFTTLMRVRAQFGNEPLVALYSGDTVLDPDIWGAGGWARAWGHLAAKLMHEIRPVPLYWLLLTATHRTYRFLPTFFREYYPRPGFEMTPVYRGRLEALVRQKFVAEYDAARGIVRTNRPLLVKRERIDLATAGITEEHAAFFAERNPGYLQGDYLVCITDLSERNRTRLGNRLFSLESP